MIPCAAAIAWGWSVVNGVLCLLVTLLIGWIGYRSGYRVGRERGRLEATRDQIAWVENLTRRYLLLGKEER